MTVLELKENRAKLVHDARKLIDTADAEKRELTGEESHKVDELFAEADKLEARIDTAEKREAVEAAEGRLKQAERRTRPTLSKIEDEPNYSDALRCWLSRGVRGSRITGADVENAARCGLDIASNEIELSRPKISRRDMAKGNTAGVVGWTDFYTGFFEEMKSYGPVLSLISYRDSDNGQALPIPVMDDTANKAAILAEAAQTNAADVSVSSVTLNGFKYESKEVILSLELLADSSVDLEAYVAKAIAERFGRGWAEHVTIGTGSGQPFGIVTRATNSSVVAGGSAAAPTLTGDNLIDLAESLDDAYRAGPGVGFMMAPATMTKVRKLKDSNGQYLWQPSLQAGVPGTFYGFPMFRNQAMATSGANARIAVFGDFSKYLWRNVAGVQVYRLDQLRIRNGQISFLAFARGDGNLIQPNAVKYLAAPAS
ncbi:MAG: phage major capsid protein [Gemmataceae bacterium]|nr:phage major capsid protein [Gemmataceae bacterium]